MSEHAGPARAPAPRGSLGRDLGRAPVRSFDRLAMCTFVCLGLPDGMIGTAWPNVRHSFRAPLADLGVLLLVGTLGALASSSVAGLVLARAGVRVTIMLGAAAAAVGALGITLSPAFWAFVVSGSAIGFAAGLFDSSVNTSVALSGRNRLLNFLHGCYGVGSSAGPLVVTAALLVSSWRLGYGALVLVELALVSAWWAAGRRQRAATAGRAGGPGTIATGGDGAGGTRRTGEGAAGGADSALPAPFAAAGPQGRRGRRRLFFVVVLGLVVFMVYVGLEVGAGQWEPSFDRGPLHLSAGATGLATFGYWGALTVVRFGLAAPRRPLPPASIVRWGCAIALGAAGVVWWRPFAIAPLVGLVVIGGALAGVFPALVALTPARVGEGIAHHVIGWQVGAAGLGGSVISAIFGFVFERYGLREFGPALVTVGLLLMAGVLVLERFSAPGPAPAHASLS